MDTLQTVFIEALNRAAHAVLSVDPDTRQEFGELSGKVICIEFTLPPADVLFDSGSRWL